MDLFTNMAERKERHRREANMLLRRHGPQALELLSQRISASDGRDRAHWKGVRKQAATIISDYRRRMRAKKRAMQKADA